MKTLLRNILTELRQIREELEQINRGIQVIKIQSNLKISVNEIDKAVKDFICS